MLQRLSPRLSPCVNQRRFSRCLASWTKDVSNPSNLVQSYISRSDDPYLNLSIEHYLLQHSPPDSAVLFLYSNKPSIILGRNQNPWLEVNLNLLNSNFEGSATKDIVENVLLVRRRSGGGTVFHDEGNVNWSVISPPADFTRDKHAEMVVRALRENGIERARVNERHDIVLDQGHNRHTHESSDLHRTPFTSDDPTAPRSIKVSGSAYKLTRRRAMHHGTCLLSSPNLSIIPRYLRSPARPFVKAKGVESVSSPVGNIGLGNDLFKDAVHVAFRSMYGGNEGHHVVGDEALEEPKVKEYMNETKTLAWTFGQTPQFTFSTHKTSDDVRERPQLPSYLPTSTQVLLDARRGEVMDLMISVSADTAATHEGAAVLTARLKGCQFYDFGSWADVLNRSNFKASSEDIAALCAWLDNILPTRVQTGEVS